VLLATAGEWRARAPAVLGRFAVAAVVAGIAILPVYVPYRRAAREQGMVRTLESVAEYSATLKGYLAAAGTVHYSTWSGQFFANAVDSFFPGFVVIALALLAIVWSWRSGVPLRTRVGMLVAVAVTGVVLSLGTKTPIYGWLFTVFPPMAGLRAAARFGNLFLLGMAILAGLGLARLRDRLGRTRRAAIAGAVLVVLANVESLRAPFLYTRFTGIPRIYSLLAAEPGPVVLAEVPFYPGHAVFENAGYVLNSTAHWRPLMNGYSGYTPASYRKYADAFWYFPRDFAIQAMKDAGVTHIMVHPHRFLHEADEVIAKISARRDLELVAVGTDDLRLYRLR
jgi:hypothetical protein